MTIRSNSFILAGLAAIGFALLTGGASQAQGYGAGGYGYGQPNYGGFRAPAYHPPSVHTDLQYHPTRTHWTPFRGVHTHGHYDAVPHYTPGHVDTYHNGHVDPNPYYHHR